MTACSTGAGDIATNRRDEQELAMVAMHVLQASPVSINMLLIQQALAEPAWSERMTSADLQALTPLIYAHVTPYGGFHLDMKARVELCPTASLCSELEARAIATNSAEKAPSSLDGHQ